MKYFIPFVALGAAACAQTALDQNLGLRLTVDPLTVPEPTYNVTWWGKQESHYLVEFTPDLVAGWTFLPSYSKGGANAPMGIGYQEDSARFFFRVWQFDPTDLGTLADSDTDGMADKWEQYHFGNLSATAAGDADSDGVTNLNEYLGGTNPNSNEGYTVTLFQASDENFDPLEDGSIIDLEETSYFKIIITPQFPTIKAALVRPTFSQITAGGNTIELTTDNTQLINTTPGQSELRVTSEPPMVAMSFVVIPGANDNDLAREKAAYDSGSTDASQKGNLTDSDAFMSNFTFDGTSSVASRGRASFAIGDFPVGPDSVRHAGWQYVDFEYGDELGPLPIPSQADFFYYSGHGGHLLGKLLIGSNPDAPGVRSMGPGDVKWNEDLDVVIIAGCSILDINNYEENVGDDGYVPAPGYKPGDDWSKTGPRIFLGYNWKAPNDLQEGVGYAASMIINSWIQNREVGGDVDAWRGANNANYGRNACAIDVTSGVGNRSYYYFKETGFIFKVWVWTQVPEGSW
jgi:hypothetical protein